MCSVFLKITTAEKTANPQALVRNTKLDSQAGGHRIAGNFALCHGLCEKQLDVFPADTCPWDVCVI